MEQHIQRYTKYIHEIVHKMDLDTATYKDHLHKVFEWYGCIQLTRSSGKIVLRWEDIPADLREKKGMSRDMGIDAWDIEGDCVIQMKLYSGCISWRSFSTFWSACFTSFEDSKKILYRNTESILHPLIQANLSTGKLVDMTVTDTEFRSECRKIQKQRFRASVTIKDCFIMRPYQEEAMSIIEKAKDEKKNILVCVPTGTGKTVITLHYHLAHPDERMLILVPTLVLMEQWNDACKALEIQTYLIGTNQHRSLEDYADQSVVICVYDSFGIIAGEIDRFDRPVIDEAHHVLVPERYMETDPDHVCLESDEEMEEDEEDEEDEEVIKEKSISYISYIRSLYDTQKAIYLSATIDKPSDGSLFYEYKVRQAIQDGYLCDYEFIFPIFEKEYETNQHLAEYLVHRQQETHCLVYASNCAEGKAFVDQLNALQPGCAGYVDGTTRPASRKKLFADFESGKIRFLVNIRVLVEGFDAPHIRSVFFLRVSSSDIFIIQAIGRALRLHADKIKARVYVPFTHEGDIDRIQAFLTQLASYDERVGESILGKRVGGYVRLERGEARAEGKEDGDDGEEKGDETAVFEFRYNLVVDRMGGGVQLEAIWFKKLTEIKHFIDTYQRRPRDGRNKISGKDDSVLEEEPILCGWLNTQKQNYKKNMYTMKNEIINKLWVEFVNDEKYKKYMLDNDDLWFYNLERVKAYIDKEKKRPNQESKDIVVKEMGSWCQRNITLYQNKQGGKRYRLERSLIWTEFTNDPKYKDYFVKPEDYWKSRLDRVKNYIEMNDDRPTYYRCKTKDDKELGKWVDHQISNYNTKKDIVYNNTEIKQLWEQFLKKYSIHFMTQEEKWVYKLEKCKEFIKENNKRPNNKSKNKEERTLAYWILNQVGNYRNKCEILGEKESLQQLWVPFITDVNKLRGQLSIDDKIQIIRLHTSGKTGRDIAEQFRVSPPTISLIIKDRKKYEESINMPT